MSRPDVDTLDLPPDPSASCEPLAVYYDAEFTDLTSDSDLLSIGFVAADSSAELYIEIADANFAIASHFVRTEVMPLFGQHNPVVLTRYKAAERIAEWLDGLREGDRQRQIIMVSDSQSDWMHFLELFPASNPDEPSWAAQFDLVGRMVHQMLECGRHQAAFDQELEAYFWQHKPRHHALVDARGLKAAWERSRWPGL